MVNMMAKKNGKGIYLAALLLFLGGLGYLIFSGLSEDSVYFLNVSEALAMDQQELKQARLFGKVSPDNIQRASDNIGVDFLLQDKLENGKTIPVTYRGAVPETFKPGVEVIVEGTFTPDRVFKATSLVTKCPSKYEEKSREMEGETSS